MLIRRVFIVGLFLLWATACGDQEEAKIKTLAAEAAKTIAKQSQYVLETQAAEIKGTTVAKVAAEAAKHGIARWKVGVDPGHGWLGAPGAVADDMHEKDIVLDIALRTKAILERDPRSLAEK